MAKLQTIHLQAEKQVDIALDTSPSVSFYERSPGGASSNYKTITSDGILLPSGQPRQLEFTSANGVTLTINDPVSANSVVLTNSADDVLANADITYTFNFDDGAHQKVTFSSDCTVAFEFPDSLATSFILEMVNAEANTITWPVGMEWPSGTVPTFTTSGIDLLVVYQAPDGTVYGNLVNTDVSAP